MPTADKKTTKKAGPGSTAMLLGLALTAITLQLFLASPTSALANDPVANAPASNSPAGAAPPRRTSLINPLGSGVTIQTLAGRAARGFVGLSGSFALLMFVYGAFLWVTSAGSADKITKGKKIFTWAVIGLIVIFGSYAFLKTFLDTLGS